MHVARRYLCPACRSNRKDFEIVYKLIQEVQLDAVSGELLFQSDELATLIRSDGRPDLDVRCGRCRYTGSESSFRRAAERDDSEYRPHQPLTSRRS